MRIRRFMMLILVTILTFALVGGSFALTQLVTATQGSGVDNHISEIVSPDSQWEKVVEVSDSGFVEGINFNREGQMWMVDVMTGHIMKLEGDRVVNVGEPYRMPNGAKFHKDGRLFIADRLGELYTLNTSTGERSSILSMYNQEHLRGLNDLIFDNSGGLYITEPYGSSATNPTGRVFYLPPGDNKLQLFQSNLAYPNGIAISADGSRIYIAEFAKNRIISAPSVNNEGPEVPFVFCQFEGGLGPDGLAVDADGNLYVARFQAGEIAVVDPNGFKFGSIYLPESTGTFNTNMAFNDGYLYVTESSKNEVWRIKVKNNGLQLYGTQ